MKIVIINGSPRKNGATNKILNKLIENIKNKLSDTEINHINLFEIKPEYCIGCLNCYKTGKCYNKNDKVEEIHDLMDNCDGIIMGSPTYASNVSGLFKNFHDRVHMTVEQLLYKKPCVVISTYENIIGNKTTSILKEMVLNAGGYVSGSLTIKNGFNKNPVINNENKINKVSSKFIKNISKKRIPLFNKIYNYIAVNIFLKPFVLRNKEQYNGIIEMWKRKGIM